MELTEIEKRITSQNGEDGIIEFLLGRLREVKREVVELGCGSGKENISRNLIQKGFSAFCIESKISRAAQHAHRYATLKISGTVTTLCCAVTVMNAAELAGCIPHHQPDVFSIDIDGVDLWVADEMLKEKTGFKPRIVVAEYNAAFMDLSCGVPLSRYHKPVINKLIDYGAGVEAWRRMMAAHGYQFLTVDSSGTNAFFIQLGESRFKTLKRDVNWLDWADCRMIAERHGPAPERLAMMQKGRHYVEIDQWPK